MADKTRFPLLLEPGQIGAVKTKNRMFKTGANSTLGDRSERLNERYKTFYGALARGGVGLIVVEGGIFDRPETERLSSGGDSFFSAVDDNAIKSIRELTGLIHKYKCPTFLQIMHGGATAGAPGVQPFSSSQLTRDELKDRHPYHKGYLLEYPSPRALTIEEIESLVDGFANRAWQAREAGFDGVEVNACNGHLLNAFVSRVWNRRQDRYGCQSLENRARFLVEIVQEIKKRLGRDFPVTVLYNAVEYGLEDCTTLEEGLKLAQLFQNAGADAIQTRVHGYKEITMDTIWPERLFYPAPPEPLPKDLDWSRRGAGAHLPVSARTKKVVSVPVMVAGRLDAELAERALRRGQADFIGITRRLQADPEFPNKIASGRLEDIAPCTACSHCLAANVFRQPIVCRVNAALGGEQEYAIKVVENATRRKKIVVVGGGPAGMEAARVAALRGHEVSLYESGTMLGGLMPLAAIVKGTEIEDLPALARYLENQIRKLGVKINLRKKFTLSTAEETRPDAVILATGGTPVLPEIPGINRSNVVSSSHLHHQLKVMLKFLEPEAIRRLTRFWLPLGKKVVIIGGAIQGCELAEFLIKRGRKVTVVETADALGDLMPVRNRMRLFKWLSQKGAVMMGGVKYEEITEKGLVIINRDNQRMLIEADTIVNALPLRPNTELLSALKEKVPLIYSIGDCNEPRLIIHAIADGYRIANSI
jgi:2,4-dienoyl-CoA reductase (NADPH2)